MQRIRVKGRAAFQSTPAAYMRDMLRYDDGRIEAIWDYPTGQRGESVRFTAIVQLASYTLDRWMSFGLATDVLEDVGTYSCQGYTVDEWLEERGQELPPERPSTRGQELAGGVAVAAFRRDGRVAKMRGCE